VDHDAVMGWVAGYERAWRERDLEAVAELFSDDAQYRVSPYAEPKTGHQGIQEIWREPDGTTFSMTAEPVAVEGRDAVVRVDVHYETPRRQEYRDLWVLRFADDGRVAEFEEWAYWPDKPYTASGEAT
jgi:ketosteroid isomerase-like protein